MFFDRPESGELAVLVHIDFSSEAEPEDPREFEQLVLSAGGDPVAYVMGTRKGPDSRFFVGTGKVEEIHQQVLAHGAQLVVFNHGLTPSQERNLEQVLQCRVLDRTGLILDIFAQRARTHEGKLQVELAQLHYMATRLVRGWTHLERQKGGIGLRGPGETQLETDRRLLRVRIDSIKKRLEKVHRQRQQGRRARQRADIPTIALVGYTNAGKSTLFNRMTEAQVYAADQLFATLDPTLRRIDLPDVGPAVLADTVGFIRHLPHRLVEAFKATLEEASSADLLLHLIDCASDEREANIQQVNHVLKEIDAFDLPTLLVYNKLDLLPDRVPQIDRDEHGVPTAVWVSAATGAGMDLLLRAISERVGDDIVHARVVLGQAAGRLRARLYAQSAVLSEGITDAGDMEVEIRLPRKDLLRLCTQEGVEAASLVPGLVVEE